MSNDSNVYAQNQESSVSVRPRLVYTVNQAPVQLGDKVSIRGEEMVVQYFEPPHKPSAEGRVTVAPLGSGSCREFYVGVIGAEWIDRGDR